MSPSQELSGVQPRACVLCGGALRRFISDITDWEYGVSHASELVRCANCGLVTHDPPIRVEDIPGLYPATYLAHSGPSTGRGVYGALKRLLRQRTISGIDRLIPANGTLLEVGCGNCQLLRDVRAARADVRLVGVDIEAVSHEPISNFEFLHGQLEEVQLADSSVDIIYCSNLIEHVADPRRFLDVCRRVLKPGGRIYGITPDHASFDRLLFRRYWAGYHYPRHTFLFDHDNIKLLFAGQGFTEVKTSGSYSFWYLSLANRFVELPGNKKRGVWFALVTALFLPLDVCINLFTTHGSMTFEASKPLSR